MAFLYAGPCRNQKDARARALAKAMPASDAYEERPSLPPAGTACLVAEALGREGQGRKVKGAFGWEGVGQRLGKH